MTASEAHEGCIRCREGGRGPLRKCQKLVAGSQKPAAAAAGGKAQNSLAGILLPVAKVICFGNLK